MSGVADSSRSPILAAVFGLGFSAILTQLVLVRELLATFAGNELVLGLVIGLWLILTGAGAWAGRRGTEHPAKSSRALVPLQVSVAVLPWIQVFALRFLAPRVFTRGASLGLTETFVTAGLLLAPYCLVSGLLLVRASSIAGAVDPDRGVARVYAADVLGGCLGGVLFGGVLSRFLDHLALLSVPAFLNLLLAGWMARSWGQTGYLRALVTPATVGGLAFVFLAEPDALSTRLQYPRQEILSQANSPYGRWVVTRTGNQLNLYENGEAFMSSGNRERVEEAVHYVMAQRPEASEVLLISGGISGTAQEILKYPVRRVAYVELDPLLIGLGQRFFPGTLEDGRIQTFNTDGRRFVQRTQQRFDVVVVDLPDPSTAQLNRFYTREFFEEIRRVLKPGGVFGFWLGHYANYVSPELARLLSSAHQTARQVFPSVLLLPGSRVCFLASDGSLTSELAQVMDREGIDRGFLTTHYLNATLTPDRLQDLQRALETPARLNEDFRPILYSYHLRHWLSRHESGWNWLQVLLLAVCGWWAIRLQVIPLAVYASGFAASSLQLVLLFVFQVWFGALYLQIGWLLTLFMAGLAAGAWVVSRRRWHRPQRALGTLIGGVLGFALLLPLCLQAFKGIQTAGAAAWTGSGLIGLLTVLLAGVVGAIFPLAVRLTRGTAGARASAVYTADFMGAAMGALLTAAWLMPLVGLWGVCLAAAGLNVWSATRMAVNREWRS